jgi:alpha-tubulin suppressor-like RCC1 family protein
MRLVGSNRWGQLGVPKSKEEVVVPFTLGNEIFSNQEIIKVVCAHDASLFLSRNGNIFGCGELFESELKPIPAQVDGKIIDVVAGRQHILFLTNTNRLYGWGLNDKGQLGISRYTSTEHYHQLMPISPQTFPDEILMVECGGWHSIVVTVHNKYGATLSESITIKSCGGNSFGEIGRGKANDLWDIMPLNMMGDEKGLKKITCGAYHTLMLTSDGKLYGCGYNGNGELGTARSNESTLVLLFSQMKFKNVSSGYYSTLYQTMDGKIFVSGSNYNNGLGIQKLYESCLFELRELTQFSGITVVDFVNCGYHRFLITDSGTLYAGGENKYGQLFLGHKEPVEDYQIIEYDTRQKNLRVAGGAHFSVIYLSETTLTKQLSKLYEILNWQKLIDTTFIFE